MSDYCIYAHISPSGKVYIGQTAQKPSKRWGKNGQNYLRNKKSGVPMHPLFSRAIEKYGWDNIQHKVLFEGLTKEEANLIEIDLIYYYQKIDKSYNITAGGQSGMTKKLTDEQCKANHNAYQKKWSASHKENVKKAQSKWRESHKDEYNAYMREFRKTHTSPDYTEYYTAYREEHREGLRAKDKAWYEANKDEINARRRAKYAAKKQQNNGNILSK